VFCWEQLERIGYGSGTWLLLGTRSRGRVCLAGFNGLRMHGKRRGARLAASALGSTPDSRDGGTTMAGPQQCVLRELLS
jgi:hypothetical protein